MILGISFEAFHIFILCILGLMLFSLGLSFGELNSLKNDFKSLDYDRLKQEYDDLDRLVSIKRENERK